MKIMTEAEKILNKFIKGDIARDYDEASRKHYTITLQTALEAIQIALNKPNVSGHFCRFGCQLRDGIWYAENGHRCAGQNCSQHILSAPVKLKNNDV